MSLRRLSPTNRKAEADQSLLGNDRVPTAPYNLSGRDSVRQPESISSLTDTIGIAGKSKLATTNYIYYRIYAEDGAIPSKTPATPGDPFLGRIKAISVPPPRTVRAVKRSITKVENIKGEDSESTSLFLTPYSQSPMDDAEKVLNGTGPGSTSQEPLALVAQMSDSERRALESDGRGGLASAAEPVSTSPEIQYLYYLLYDIDYEMPSKVAIDAEQPSLGRIRADSIAPPHSPASIKRCISRVEGSPALAYADLFGDTESDTPLKEGHISILRTDGPGLSPNEPMAIVQRPPNEPVAIVQRPPNEPVAIVQRPPNEPVAIVQVKNPSIPDGRYIIKNRAKGTFWHPGHNPIHTVYFYLDSMGNAKNCNQYQWDITLDAYGNISMKSPFAPSSWVGDEITGSTVPVPWRLIPADGKSYYLTTDMNRFSQNIRVPAAQEGQSAIGSMATLKEGDQRQMWEFIHI